MNKFKADFADNKLLLDMPEPIGCPENPPCFNCLKQLAEYNSRLSYSLSKELRDKLKDGEVIREDDFVVSRPNADNVNDFTDCDYCVKQRLCNCAIAIPLPEQTNDFCESTEWYIDDWGKKRCLDCNAIWNFHNAEVEQTSKVKEPERVFTHYKIELKNMSEEWNESIVDSLEKLFNTIRYLDIHLDDDTETSDGEPRSITITGIGMTREAYKEYCQNNQPSNT